MIFYQDCVSYDDFDDCHDMIAIAGVDFIARRPSCDHQRGVLLGAPNEDNYLGSSISSSLVAERNKGLKVMNLTHMLLPTMQLPIFFYRF